MPKRNRFPIHGWPGLALLVCAWILNWSLTGLRTQFLFFPLWLGYCLLVDALVYLRKGTSLLARSWKQYLGLFLISMPGWWLFEIFNRRLGDWYYQGAEVFSPFQSWFWATLNFSTVIPAVFSSAELAGSFSWVKKIGRGPAIPLNRRTTISFFCAGWIMLVLMLLFPSLFFPFVWLSVYFILEPVNVWSGNRSLTSHTAQGDWRPVLALWAGVLLTAFFWEMWNYYSYPKWVYHVPWGNSLHIFEMPLLGYGGYLPFALELFALVHLIYGFLGQKKSTYIQLVN
jgi:hypothetical protein